LQILSFFCRSAHSIRYGSSPVTRTMEHKSRDTTLLWGILFGVILGLMPYLSERIPSAYNSARSSLAEAANQALQPIIGCDKNQYERLEKRLKLVETRLVTMAELHQSALHKVDPKVSNVEKHIATMEHRLNKFEKTLSTNSATLQRFHKSRDKPQEKRARVKPSTNDATVVAGRDLELMKQEIHELKRTMSNQANEVGRDISKSPQIWEATHLMHHIKLLVTNLRTNLDDEQVVGAALEDLKEFSRSYPSNPSINEPLKESELLVIAEAMGEYPRNYHIQVTGSETLGNLALSNNKNKIRIGAVGGVRAIVNAVRTFGFFKEGYQACLSLAFNSEGNKAEMVEAGAIEWTLFEIGESPRKERIQSRGFALLGTLAQNNLEHAVAIGRKGGVDAAVEAMNRTLKGSEDGEDALVYACFALEALASASSENAGRLEKLQAVALARDTRKSLSPKGRGLLDVLLSSIRHRFLFV